MTNYIRQLLLFFLKDKQKMFEQILNTIDDIVWGIPTIALILVTGIVMTIATRGIQFTKLGRAFKQKI